MYAIRSYYADHVRGFDHHAGDRVVDAAAQAGLLRAGRVHDLFLSVIHEGRSILHALRHHRARGQRAVGVVKLHPVVINDASLRGVVFGDSYNFV